MPIDETIAYGRTAWGQLIYDLAFVKRTDTWLARKHGIPVQEIRNMRSIASVKRLVKAVKRDAAKAGN